MHNEILNLSQKAILEAKFKALDPDISEYSFANCYFFRKLHEYEVCTFENDVFLKGRTYDGAHYLMPTADISHYTREAVLKLFAFADCLFPISEERTDKYTQMGFEVSYKADDSDYLYLKEKTLTYAGRHLQGQRNQVLRLLDDKSVEYRPYDDFAIEVLDVWQDESGRRKEVTDYYPCLEAITLRSEIPLVGYVFYVNEVPSGLVIGEQLSSRTFAIHFSKSKKEIHGLYPYMNQVIAKAASATTLWINREQDLGKQALHLAKMSYHPDKLLKKMRITLSDRPFDSHL